MMWDPILYDENEEFTDRLPAPYCLCIFNSLYHVFNVNCKCKNKGNLMPLIFKKVYEINFLFKTQQTGCIFRMAAPANTIAELPLFVFT